MTTNPYFENHGYVPSQDLYEDLTIEALKIYGQDFKYIPRQSVSSDTIFGEDIASQFTEAYTVEMYVENIDGFEGQDLFQKFGVEIRDDATVVVSKKRWTEEVVTNGGEAFIRPREGDLVFMPFSNSLFEITFVEHEDPFYQLNNLPVFKLGLSLFEYSDENIDLDEIGFNEEQFSGTITINVDDASGFVDGEDITQMVGAALVTGEIQSIDGNKITVSNVSNNTDEFVVFTDNLPITGMISGFVATMAMAAFIDDTSGENDELQAEADEITSPFGF